VHEEWKRSTSQQRKWRPRTIQVFGYQSTMLTPDTVVFRTRLLSRLLLRFPFIMEIIYWALIYSIYQMGRGFLASRLSDRTIDIACPHALQVISIEEHSVCSESLTSSVGSYNTLMSCGGSIASIPTFIFQPLSRSLLACIGSPLPGAATR
jgi:hypothetical protein